MISVIITSYNIEKYIEQCLQSVLDQTYADLEIIVVDDGSTDATPQVIQSLANRDRRIVPILLPENTPGGVAVAANVGIRRATKKYIGFVDGDDWCEPNMFAQLLSAAEDNDAEIVVGNFKNYDEKTGDFYDAADAKRWLHGLPLGSRITSMHERKELLRFNPVPWRKLYLREFLDRNKIFFPEGDYFYEDNPFHWFCVTQAKSFALVNEYLCYHRMNREGQTMGSADGRLLAMYEHHNTIHDWLIEVGGYEEFCEELVLWVTNNTCWIYEAIKDELKPNVIESLANSLNKHELNFVYSVIMSENMGNRGRELANEALSYIGFKPREGVSAFDKSLLAEARLHYNKYGFIKTVQRAKSYIYHRSPPPIKRVLESLSAKKKKRQSGSNSEVLKKLDHISRQVEFQKYMMALGYEFEKSVLTDLESIKQELAKLKSSVNQKDEVE